MIAIDQDEAKQKLLELIEAALRGQEVYITRDDQRIVQITAVSSRPHKKRKAGGAKGLIWMADDFDAPLDDFAEDDPALRVQAVANIDALRARLYSKYGQLPDSVDLIREDRDR